jgi:hypothetical protein
MQDIMFSAHAFALFALAVILIWIGVSVLAVLVATAPDNTRRILSGLATAALTALAVWAMLRHL